MTSFLLRTTSSSEHANDEYDYAIVEMDDRSAKVIAGFLNQFKITSKSQPRLLDMIFDETNCRFYPGMYLEDGDRIKGLTNGQQNHFDDRSWVQLDDGFELPDLDDSHEPDYVALVVNEHGFFWRAYPAFSDITIETFMLPNDTLSRLL